MSQYTINIGALPNDGTGDPLRTAFNEVNLNFNQVFAAGPVLSNIQIANNTILTTNTNGNLVLAPNGIGVVQSNVSIVPNTANIRNLGAADRRWSTVYVQYANVSGALAVANLTATGNVTVGGNLSVTGNIVYIGNLITDAKTIQLANTAGTANAANGSGITVGANDNIATMLYSSAANAWTFNIGLDTPNIVVNNITSDDSTFVTIQDGLDVQGSITAETLSVAGNITGGNLLAPGAVIATLLTGGNLQVTGGVSGSTMTAVANVTGGNILTGGLISATGNITGNYILGNISQASGFPATYGNANVVTLLAGFGSNTVSTTGNITANYFVGNGSQLTGLAATYGNANVANYLPTFSGNISAGNVSASGNITAGNIGITGSSLTWANASIVQTSASDVSITGDGQVTVRSLDGTYQWTFESNGNLTAPGNVSASGNVTGAYIKGNGSELTNLPAPVVTQDITSNGAMSIMTYDGNIKYVSYATVEPSSGNIVAGNVSTTGNITSGNLISPTLNNSGNISVVAGGNAWTFGTDGRLINLEGLTLTAGGQFNICTILTGGSGYNTGSALKATTGGSGTGMTVGIGYGLSNQLTNVGVVDPGTGYVDGDVITVSEGTGGTFVITQYNEQANQANNNFIESNWVFGNAGYLT